MEEDPPQDTTRDRAVDPLPVVNRRRFVMTMGAGALVFLAACGRNRSSTAGTGSGSTTGPTGATTSASTTSASSATASSTSSSRLTAVPEETAGPYPGDGSNGIDVLTQSGIVRSDIRASFGSGTKTATGVPMTLQLTVLDASTGKPLQGAAVYVWHCDSDGNYSLYSQGLTGENYLRGVQAADANGVVTFRSIYPACYPGRWPHIHYEVYPSISATAKPAGKRATSPIALLDGVNKLVYATSDYSGSKANYAQVSLATDNVFSDGTTGEVPTVTGSVSAGYTVAIKAPVNA